MVYKIAKVSRSCGEFYVQDIINVRISNKVEAIKRLINRFYKDDPYVEENFSISVDNKVVTLDEENEYYILGDGDYAFKWGAVERLVGKDESNIHVQKFMDKHDVDNIEYKEGLKGELETYI